MRARRTLSALIGLFASSLVFGGELSVADMDGVGCEQIDGASVCLTLLFSGKIEKGDGERLSRKITRLTGEMGKLLKTRVRVGKVHFDSPGGDLHEAMKVGRIIRDNLMVTQVTHDSICSSACVVAFLGGVFRIPVGPMGIHSFYSKEFLGQADYAVASKQYDAVSVQVETYLRTMRIPVVFLDEMKSIPHYNIRILEFEEMKRLGVIGIDPVYAQIRDSNKSRTNR